MRENKSTKVRHGLFIIPPKQSCYCSFATPQKQFITSWLWEAIVGKISLLWDNVQGGQRWGYSEAKQGVEVTTYTVCWKSLCIAFFSVKTIITQCLFIQDYQRDTRAGPVAVAVDIGDLRQVTCDMLHMTHDILFFFK